MLMLQKKSELPILGGKKKWLHWSAVDNSVCFGPDKNLVYIPKAVLTLDTYASANAIGISWAQVHGKWLVLAVLLR